MKITKNMLIGEVISKYPKTIEVFLKQGLGCIGCGMAQLETIEQGAKAHGIDIKKLVDELNKVIKK
jgi:hybrid cluster-associated redox disulfide protein